MDERTLAAYLKRLACPRCRKRYDQADLLFIESAASSRQLNLRCMRCRLRTQITLPTASKRRAAPSNQESKARKRSRRSHKPISMAEVAEMRRFLADFRGNFADLLRRP